MKKFNIDRYEDSSTESLRCLVEDLEGTKEFARVFAGALKQGDIIGISGELGVGKTEFVRQILAHLGVVEDVVSPSFVLESVYQGENQDGKIQISHWDLYRLNGKSEILELGEYKLNNSFLTFIEWPEAGKGVNDLLSMHILLKFADENANSTADQQLNNQRILDIDIKDNNFKRRFLKNLNEHGCK